LCLLAETPFGLGSVGESVAAIDTYRYLWDDKDSGWVLYLLNPLEPGSRARYVIKNETTQRALLISDSEVYRAVIERMLLSISEDKFATDG